MTDAGRETATGWWRARVPLAAGGAARLVYVHSRAEPDDTEISVGADWSPPPETIGTVIVDELGLPTSVQVETAVAPRAPQLWFAELRESTALPPATNLLAFTGHGIGPGRLLDAAALADVDVASEDQLGAVRWYPASGEIDQIYVAPQCRRQGVATVLLHAAGMLSRAHDWPRLWSDGQRTVLGEHLRNARDWAHLAAELTHIAPPMTPAEPGG